MKYIPPTKPGYYWVKDKGDPFILQVNFMPTIKFKHGTPNWDVKQELQWLLHFGVNVKSREYQWVGPLRAPVETSKKYREKIPIMKGWYWCIAPYFIGAQFVKLFRFPHDRQLYIFLQIALARPVTKKSCEGFKWYGPLQPPKKLMGKTLS